MIVLFVLKSYSPAEIASVHSIDGCQKWMRFGADHEGKRPAPGTCKLNGHFSIGTWEARVSQGGRGALMLSGLVSLKAETSRRRQRSTEAPKQWAESCKGVLLQR